MEPQSTQDATKRATRILDAKYSKADLQSVVRDNYKHLKADQHKKLLQLLKKYKSLFDGTLGDWKTKPVSFQLKEGVSPYHGRAFPVPKIHKDTLIKEVDRLFNWGYWSGSQHLNMGCYTIRLNPDASRICTIIFPWGKYSYKRLPMGIASSPDIFQSKMSEPMEDLEYVQAYLDDLLCISRSSLEDHLKKLKEVLRCLHDADLKVNAEKLTFCALEIEYLGYILTRDGIKPQSN
jgi:hypothetical protein